jgi:hypothetical protein
MLISTTKRFVLPFSDRQSSSAELESAAVFALAELSRSKGGLLIARQPPEKLTFLLKVTYPLWFYPKNNQGFIFDGLGRGSFSVSYSEVPTAKAFMNSLTASSQPRENYEAFLSDNANYFQRKVTQKKFALAGLIVDSDFKREFSALRKEATDASASNLPMLLPSVEESKISNMLVELERLQTHLKEDTQQLSECLRLISKTTSQYLSELDFQALAAREEADARIKAQEQIVNPQVAQLNKAYSRKIKETAVGFDAELESLAKLEDKTNRFIEKNVEEGKGYAAEAKAQAARGHKIYEQRWKDKVKVAKKELNGLRKELKNMESQRKKLVSQKQQAISKLTFELDREVKLARQPIVLLVEEREIRLRFFRQETAKLLALEKLVVEDINKSIEARNLVAADFDALSMAEVWLKSPALLFLPFYLACYEVGLARRYLVVAPSNMGSIDFSAKLKGVLGISKLKDLLIPRCKTICAFVQDVQVYIKQNSVFEKQLLELGQKSNLLGSSGFLENAQKGLIALRNQGWLSEREEQELTARLST